MERRTALYARVSSEAQAPDNTVASQLASSSGKRGASSPNMPAPSDAARRFSTLGITCRFSCASPAR